MSRLLLGIAISAILPQFTLPAVAQQAAGRYSSNCVYLEAGGPGILYSIDYERRFTESVSARIGFSHWSLPTFGGFFSGEFTLTAIPIMANYLFGSNGNYLELGMGPVICNIGFAGQALFFGNSLSGQSTKVIGAASICYRCQPENGVMFRIGLTPLTRFTETRLWGGLSLGIAF